MPVGDECVCDPGYEPLGEGCGLSPVKCSAPQVLDVPSGLCVCPSGSTLKGEGCTVPCTIQDIIDQFQTDGPCGSTYTDCLKDACDDEWNMDCLDMINGDLAIEFIMTRDSWNNCLVNDVLMPGGGCLAGKSKCSGKSKSGKSKRRVRELNSKNRHLKSKSNKSGKSKKSGKSIKLAAPGPNFNPNPGTPSRCALQCASVGCTPLGPNPGLGPGPGPGTDDDCPGGKSKCDGKKSKKSNKSNKSNRRR
jgi:hypothetical protein